MKVLDTVWKQIFDIMATAHISDTTLDTCCKETDLYRSKNRRHRSTRSPIKAQSSYAWTDSGCFQAACRLWVDCMAPVYK